MKAKLLITAMALASIMTSAQARPPFPPSPASKEPVIIICKDMNALTEAEIEELNNDVEKIVSADQDLREVCFRAN